MLLAYAFRTFGESYLNESLYRTAHIVFSHAIIVADLGFELSRASSPHWSPSANVELLDK